MNPLIFPTVCYCTDEQCCGLKLTIALYPGLKKWIHNYSFGNLGKFIQDEDSEAVLAADFEIGHFIRERIVPRAVLYFTGEAIEDDDDDVRVDG